MLSTLTGFVHEAGYDATQLLTATGLGKAWALKRGGIGEQALNLKGRCFLMPKCLAYDCCPVGWDWDSAERRWTAFHAANKKYMLALSACATTKQMRAAAPLYNAVITRKSLGQLVFDLPPVPPSVYEQRAARLRETGKLRIAWTTGSEVRRDWARVGVRMRVRAG